MNKEGFPTVTASPKGLGRVTAWRERDGYTRQQPKLFSLICEIANQQRQRKTFSAPRTQGRNPLRKGSSTKYAICYFHLISFNKSALSGYITAVLYF